MRMVNQTAWPHAMHLHGHHVQELDGGGRIAAKTPWRDTILVKRGEDRFRRIRRGQSRPLDVALPHVGTSGRRHGDLVSRRMISRDLSNRIGANRGRATRTE